jgi:hypothetical protein
LTHEDFNRQDAIRGSSDRGFGGVMAAFFGLVALWPLIRAEGPRWWALALAAAFALAAVLRPAVLAPLNAGWTRLGVLLSRIASPLILAALFYLTVTPIALIARVLGKDPLRLNRDPDTTSYWIVRSPPGPDPASMKNQF